ncbi:hypothetical protein N7492_010563 [Penicillium capsulatum]|uniref:Leucine-rich repeat domain-containing protein n=1 Tax=Penicillium capsulatum TaxID=69766 RepID=A0A9W9HLE2_9EURO|nr:hypothetical protein N7492_010563 [Penicillium capsulatum]KAJ6113063.1 hypothetical protein N7512_008387 [Penicillium capsulatum]
MLIDLPTEVLVLIGEHLPRQNDLYHLVVSSRRLSDALLPSLYADVTLCNTVAHPSVQVSCFFYAVTRHPKLARAVRSLALEVWDLPCDFYHRVRVQDSIPIEPDKPAVAYDADIIDPLLTKANVSEAERVGWAKDIHNGITDAWLALTVPQLTQLRKIRITWPNKCGDVQGLDGWFSSMLTRASREESPRFPHLEEAYFTWWDTENSVGSHVMLPFFHFPAMRRLSGCQVEDQSDERNPASIVPTSGITTIALCCAGGTDGGLRDWIAACKALEVFSFDFGGPLVTELGYNPAPIVQSLLLHRTTMVSIHIRQLHEYEIDDEEDKIQSFAEFTALKHLSIDVFDLVEMTTVEDLQNAFPSSLETLRLRYSDWELLGRITPLLQGLVATRFWPQLATLTIEAARIPTDDQDASGESALRTELNGLELRCQEAGISLTSAVIQ